jgi:hypothetical protein
MFLKLNLSTDYFVYVNVNYIISIAPVDDNSCNLVVSDGSSATKYYCIESCERLLNLIESKK